MLSFINGFDPDIICRDIIYFGKPVSLGECSEKSARSAARKVNRYLKKNQYHTMVKLKPRLQGNTTVYELFA